MGMLLDPLGRQVADRRCLYYLVQFNPSLVPAWIAVVIIGREFLVSGLRSIAASEGFTIEASELGKFKMVVQIVAVVAVILDHRWKEWPVGTYIFPVTGLLSRHLVHGCALAGFRLRLFHGILVEDRPPAGKAPPARVRPQPAEEERCARNLRFSQAIQEFSREDRISLLDLAHRSIDAASPDTNFARAVHPHLAEPRGVFTTLYYRGRLRGCVGHVFPRSSIYRAVADTARAAAFEDTRFYPVTAGEAQELEISLSILSVLKPIRPEEVEVGVHGLLISMAGKAWPVAAAGAAEHKWDRVQYLEQTCRKAGLPNDAWHSGARLETFTAEVFGDREM